MPTSSTKPYYLQYVKIITLLLLLMENFCPIFKLHIRCFGIQGTPKNMTCHYFFQEGGGSSLDHLFIIYVVIMASGGRGVNPICTFSLNIPGFFWKAPLTFIRPLWDYMVQVEAPSTPECQEGIPSQSKSRWTVWDIDGTLSKGNFK